MTTLLTVDDSAMMREIIAQAGEALGCHVLQAEDGEKALEVLGQQEPAIDIVLLDWNMPGMDGLTVLKKIRSDDRLAAIPVMMVTTESEGGNILKAINEGADQYITKPFVMEDLVTKIKACADRGRQAS